MQIICYRVGDHRKPLVMGAERTPIASKVTDDKCKRHEKGNHHSEVSHIILYRLAHT